MEIKELLEINRGYTIIPNELLYNKEISNNAKLLYIFLNSRIYKTIKHSYQMNNIRELSKYGRDKFYKALKELIENGWITRTEETINNNLKIYFYKIVIQK